MMAAGAVPTAARLGEASEQAGGGVRGGGRLVADQEARQTAFDLAIIRVWRVVIGLLDGEMSSQRYWMEDQLAVDGRERSDKAVGGRFR